MSWSTSELRVRLAPWNRLSSPVKYFTDRSKAVHLLWIFYVFSALCLLCLCARLFICALWSPARKGLTSWLLFVVSYCEFVTFPLVSWVRCGTWLYRFLIFSPLLTLHPFWSSDLKQSNEYSIKQPSDLWETNVWIGLWQSKWVALGKRSQVSLTFGTYIKPLSHRV